MTDNGYEIRLLGAEGDVTPEGFPLSKLGVLLTQFEKLVASDTQGAVLSLVNIRNKCISLGLASNISLIAKFEEVARCASVGTAENLGYKRRKAFDAINNLLWEESLHAEFFEGRKKLGSLKPTKKEGGQSVVIKCTATVYGELVSIGGKKPKASIEQRDGNTIECSISDKAVAQSLASKLYTQIRVKGHGLRLMTTGRFTEFTIESVLPFEQKPINEVFDILRREFGSAYSNIHPDEFVADLRAD